MNSSRLDVCLAILYHATELAGGRPVRIRDIAVRYANNQDPEDLFNCLSNPGNHDYVDFSDQELNPLDRKVQITLRGTERIEGIYGENVASFLEQRGIQYNYDVFASDVDLPERVDSATWTGIAERIGPAQLREISDKAAALRDSIAQSPLDGRAKANALKRIDAVRALLEAPDPPWKVIVELLNSPVLTAFLNAAAIMTIIFG